MATKPKLKREPTITVYLTQAECTLLQRYVSALGRGDNDTERSLKRSLYRKLQWLLEPNPHA
jgi:hypothetical protein